MPHDFVKKESMVELLPTDPMEFPRAKLHLLNRVLGKWLLLPCCFFCCYFFMFVMFVIIFVVMFVILS